MFDFIKGLGGSLINPFTDLASEFIEDKDKANELAQKLKMVVMEKASEELSARKDIIVAEAQSESWITRSWRPISMLSFVVMLFIYWFGLAPEYIQESENAIEWLMDIIKFGLGGYIVGRSGEKIADKVLKSKSK